MEITQEIRKEASGQQTHAQQFLYKHPSSGGKLFSIAQIYNLSSEESYVIFASTVGDIILGFYKIEDTVPLLQQELELDAKTAALLGADVLDFLAPLSDPNWQPPVEVEMSDDELVFPASNSADTATTEISAGVSAIPESILATAPPQPTPNFIIPANLVARVAPAPAQPLLVPELHTMASDATLARSPERSSFQPSVVEEVIHSSTQPEFRSKLSDLPAYTSKAPDNIPSASPITPEPPRWGN